MERPSFEVMRSDDDPFAVGIREDGQETAVVFHTDVEMGKILYLSMVGTFLKTGCVVAFYDGLDVEYFNGHD